MKYQRTKHTILGIAALVSISLSTASCVGDDDTTATTSPECVVTSFGVGTIKTEVVETEYDKDGNAKDVVKTKSILGTDISFNIDQVNGHIYTTDSLPNWVDLSKVKLSFGCYGNLYYKVPDEDDLYYRLTSGSDSVDVSKTVDLLCVATDGVARKAYKLDIYKRKLATDTLIWKSTDSNLSYVGGGRMYNSYGKVIAFVRDGNGNDVSAYTAETDGASWSNPSMIPVESNSVIKRGNAFYGLSEDGYIYASADENAAVWEKVSDRHVDRLLAADGYNVYALDGTQIIGSADMDTWSVQGTADINMLPDSYCSSVYYTSKTNDDICVAVMAGLSSANSSNGVAWFKQTSAANDASQPWAYMEVTADNVYGLPHLGGMSMVIYEGSLYVMGTEDGAYGRMYRSEDNGITWHQLPQKYPLPSDLNPHNGVASMVAVGSQLWIIQEKGKIWRGSIL